MWQGWCDENGVKGTTRDVVTGVSLVWGQAPAWMRSAELGWAGLGTCAAALLSICSCAEGSSDTWSVRKWAAKGAQKWKALAGGSG